ncbi:MAG: hypothetical protein ACE5IL_17310 [Myxococcota bacterium]
MRVESQAGTFILSFEQMEPARREILITGKMGVWDAKTYMSLSEFLRLIAMTLSPRMLGFFLKALLGAGRSRAGSEG